MQNKFFQFFNAHTFTTIWVSLIEYNNECLDTIEVSYKPVNELYNECFSYLNLVDVAKLEFYDNDDALIFTWSKE